MQACDAEQRRFPAPVGRAQWARPLCPQRSASGCAPSRQYRVSMLSVPSARRRCVTTSAEADVESAEADAEPAEADAAGRDAEPVVALAPPVVVVAGRRGALLHAPRLQSAGTLATLSMRQEFRRCRWAVRSCRHALVHILWLPWVPARSRRRIAACIASAVTVRPSRRSAPAAPRRASSQQPQRTGACLGMRWLGVGTCRRSSSPRVVLV